MGLFRGFFFMDKEFFGNCRTNPAGGTYLWRERERIEKGVKR